MNSHIISNIPKTSIFGPESNRYQHDIELLVRGELPKRWQWLESSNSSKVAKQDDRSVVYKEYLPRSKLENLKGTIRGYRSLRAVRQGKILLDKGFHAPKSLCWGKYGDSSFAVFEKVAGTSLGHYIYKHWQPPLDAHSAKHRRTLIKSFAKTIGNLHRLGIVHGDLRLNNILVNVEVSPPAFCFIDNERNRVYKRIPRNQIIKNLVQLGIISTKCVTVRDRLRFFLHYANIYGRLNKLQQRTLAADVWSSTLKRFRDKSYFLDELG